MDMTPFVIPKSDQLNADDLISGPRTVRITKVSATMEPDQPVAVYFEGDNGKPYKPCKSMRRVMIHAWGVDAKEYIGRSMTLKNDPDVMFGGMKVGGIRISHMSHISRPLALSLTVTKARRAQYCVAPLKVDEATTPTASAPLSGIKTFTAVDPDTGMDSTYGEMKSGRIVNLGASSPEEDEKPSVWESGSPNKTEKCRIPLDAADGFPPRFFADVPTWCKAMCELSLSESPSALWRENKDTFDALWKAARNPDNKGHLNALADYIQAAMNPPTDPI